MPTIKWNDLPFKVYTRKQVIRKLEKAAQETTDHIKKKISGGRIWGSEGKNKSIPGQPPHVDMGHLRQSIFWELRSDTQAIIGTSKVYGLYLELGAYIRPRNAKMLAIPWSPQAKRHIRNGGKTRDFPIPCVFIKTSHGGLLVHLKQGRRKGMGLTTVRSDIHFILTGGARIPAHPFLRPGLMEMSKRIKEIFTT